MGAFWQLIEIRVFTVNSYDGDAVAFLQQAARQQRHAPFSSAASKRGSYESDSQNVELHRLLSVIGRTESQTEVCATWRGFARGRVNVFVGAVNAGKQQ